MIDIHHHLIYGLDDGAQTLEDSRAMIEMAHADGITHIVCTPHANDRYTFQPDVNAQIVAELQEIAGDRLKIGLGCDFHITWDNVNDAKANPKKYSINGLGYLMVELPDHSLPIGLTEVFYELQIAGLTPVLTHPERNPALQRFPGRMKKWLRGGLLIQVTAGSLAGRFGRTAQDFAHRMLADQWVHFIATDAHNTTSRPPVMSTAMELISEQYGTETARRLCIENPLAAFEGRRLGHQPEAIGLFEEEAPKRSWFDKLLSR